MVKLFKNINYRNENSKSNNIKQKIKVQQTKKNFIKKFILF